MKKLFSFSALPVCALLFAGCNGASKESIEPVASTPPPHDAHAGHKHSAQEAGVLHAHNTRLKFSSAPSTPIAGKNAKWTLQISDVKTGKPIPKFERVHEKLLHLIVASKDLSWFTHIHPEWKGNGVFTINYAIPRAGEYTVYADYTTPEGGHEVAIQELKIAGGNPLPTQSKVVADQLKGMWIEKKFSAHEEGKAPPANAPKYEIALMPMPGVLRAGEDAMLHFQVRDDKGKPVADLQQYLGALGHAVILSSDGKTYLHSHPLDAEAAEMMSGEDHAGHDHSTMDHSKMDHGGAPKGSAKRGGPDVIFHTLFPAPGIYKVWAQFSHKNKIITASYNLKVLPGMTKKP